ncbi:polyketide synthase [Fusarium subglutinans]|uniref:Polyketide synthase n=1 Tax=Gibberella subglutinans TaxID=42677 RepID=A0A8H5Q9D8_GIBSU|nr:polyketide synthase [Fusarium subglutinans]KAF5611606.1 polyketide synthase [Fusarium subglutinans]
MGDNALELPVLEEAKPTVRLKGKENEYVETLEYNTFQSRGGNPETLMDEERWLDFPVHVSRPLKKAKIHGSDRDASLPPMETSGTTTIWNPEPVSGLGNNRISKLDIGRKATETHVAVKLAARASNSINRLHCRTKEWISTANGMQLITNIKVSGVFVGISALNYNAIFMMKSSTQHLPDGFNGLSRRQTIKNMLNLDNTELVELVFGPEHYVQGQEIIWTENMLIPSNMSYVKRALHGHLDDGEKTRFMQLLRREHHLLVSGNGPAGVAKTLPSNEAPSRKPLICRAIQGGKGYNDLHFILRWPPMALLEFPGDMINEMQSFLDRYPSDNVPLNIALAATIVYFDIEETDDHDMEGFVDSFPGRKPALVQKAPLATFIIYFPHMLRSHRDPLEVSTVRDNLNPISMRSWVHQVRSRHPQVLADSRFTLIPASMPGSTMVFPEDCTHAERPSSDLFALCCLNDVRTLGIPSYSRNPGFPFQCVGAPKWLFTKAVQKFDKNCFSLTGNPTVAYWNTTTPETVKALTGSARAIGPVFPDVGSDYYNTEAIFSCVKRWFGDESYYTENPQFCLDNPELDRQNMATRADELIRIADRLGIPPNERRTSHETMLIEWDGMETQLKSLRKKGKLKRLAAPEYYTPPAKRAQPVEPTLSSHIKGEILQTIKGLAASSCDWDKLLKDLETPAPTIKAIHESFSHVRLFVAESEKILQDTNDGNGEGDLDHVIRLVFRAEGLFGSGVEAMDYESKWDQHRNRLSQLFGQPTGKAMEAVFRLRNTPDAFSIILPQIQVLAESSLIKDQVEAFKKIEALLGQPPTEIDDQTASGRNEGQ